MASIGPSIPTQLTHKRKRAEDETSSHTSPKRSRTSSPGFPSPARPETVGPSAPPTSSTPTSKPSPPAKQARVIGPAAPPASLSERPPHPPDPPPDDPDSDSSDSDFGPALPSTNPSHSIAPPQPDPEALRKAQEASKPQREEWMLAPPTSSDWTSRVDPTKLKNRKFQTGKSASSRPTGGKGGGGEIDSLWTETPEQKRKRLEDEVLGVKKIATADGGDGSKNGEKERRRREKDAEKEREVRELNEKMRRGGSLYEEKSKRRERDRSEGERVGGGGGDGGGKGWGGKEEEKEDDPSARAFDREKDMALGAKIGHKAKADMAARAKDFGGRFSGGGYL